MKKKSSLILDDEFIRYCEINKIDKIDTLAKETFARGFTLLKYGETPAGFGPKEKIVIKEVLKEVPVEVEKIVEIEKFIEVIKEVPVEKIVEIEKIIEVIKEVPVDRIVEVIKEVPVEIKGDTQVVIKEVIKEVPVEVKGDTQIITQEVIKEVIIEKIIDDHASKNLIIELTDANRKLKEEVNKLTEDLNKITTSLSGINKAKYMKGSDLSNLYGE